MTIKRDPDISWKQTYSSLSFYVLSYHLLATTDANYRRAICCGTTRMKIGYRLKPTWSYSTWVTNSGMHLHLLVHMFAENHSSLVCCYMKCELNLQHSCCVWHVLKSQCKASLNLKTLYKVMLQLYCVFCDTFLLQVCITSHSSQVEFWLWSISIGWLEMWEKNCWFQSVNWLDSRKTMNGLDKPWKTFLSFLMMGFSFWRRESMHW